jgi:acetyl esterase/lipase
MNAFRAIASACLFTATLAWAPSAFADAVTLMTPDQFQALPVTKPDIRLKYGSDANNIGDLRLPDGAGPFPVAVLIHGGCFMADYAKLDELSQLAEALRRDGIATWNIEYRRLGQPGGGWPGTYQDVGQAIDHLRELSPRYPLDLRKVIVIGHSAGGTLALWSASRSKLPVGGPLAAQSPIKPIGVINLAGLPDLRDNIVKYEQLCGHPVIHEMLGSEPSEVIENARAAAAIDRLPLGVEQTIILGDHEDFVPRAVAQAYVEKARSAGDKAQLVVIPDAGHFEIAATTSAAWPQVRKSILALLRATSTE